MARPKKEVDPEDVGKSPLDLVLSAIDKQFGKGMVFRSTDQSLEGTKWIPSGCMTLDRALGGGYPRGRIIEVYGNESGGKTTLSLHAIAEAQKLGLTCAFVDAEHALDVGYARKLGVDVDKLLISQPMNGEDALDLVELLSRSGEIGLIVIDSVAALTPRAELEGEMGDSSVGRQALLMSKAMRKLCGVAATTETTLFFINQLRMKITMFGNPETTAGGQSLKYYASQRLDIRRQKAVGEDGKEKTGVGAKVKVVKNKVAPPFREAEFIINFGEGIDWAEDLYQLSIASGLVVRQAASFLLGEEKIGYGMDSFKDDIRNKPGLATRLRGLLQ